MASPGGIPQPLKHTGITYRQLDYWVRQGYLKVQSSGPGIPREWTNTEIQVAQWMVRLVEVGFTVTKAHSIGRGQVNQPQPSIYLGQGMTLRFEGDQ